MEVAFQVQTRCKLAGSCTAGPSSEYRARHWRQNQMSNRAMTYEVFLGHGVVEEKEEQVK